ncbi:SDR family NAD(P)-dependent oxidoreductase [Vagococcus entomophilus]|uniref:Short-chain dehydrogenase n=1 Tax=Vagococcus entomophilus TaxID=1160095 RepID=A0A430AKX4_9ENTE|nr:SDR family NAD(P)-dependent oxidoreductase [Vagococcus entomophilus]RSU08663.1 hypothetical protein CBF30_05400 [Vagococcus entomophilus]
MNYSVITGASSGIGYATAWKLAQKKHNLILIARNDEKLTALKNNILEKDPSLDIKVFASDLSDSQEVQQLIQELDRYPLDYFINNAGFGIAGDILSTDPGKIVKMIDLDVTNLVKLSVWFAQKYQADSEKQLLNVSSTAGYELNTRAVLYAASKQFVAAFTEGLALELKKKGLPLQVKVIAPYATETNFAKTSLGSETFSYKESYEHYHTPEQMATFIFELLQSDGVVGKINPETMKLEISGPKLDWHK